MDSAALAAFVRETLPKLRSDVLAGAFTNRPERNILIAALDAVLGLLREAELHLDIIIRNADIYGNITRESLDQARTFYATLRLIVGEKP